MRHSFVVKVNFKCYSSNFGITLIFIENNFCFILLLVIVYLFRCLKILVMKPLNKTSVLKSYISTEIQPHSILMNMGTSTQTLSGNSANNQVIHHVWRMLRDYISGVSTRTHLGNSVHKLSNDLRPRCLIREKSGIAKVHSYVVMGPGGFFSYFSSVNCPSAELCRI